MHSQQKLRKIFQSQANPTTKQLKLESMPAILRTLGHNIYPASINSIHKTICKYREDLKSQDPESIGFTLFCMLIQLVINEAEKSLQEMIWEMKGSMKELKEQFKGRDLKLRDRQFQGKLKIRIGPQQQHPNQLKLTLSKTVHKSTTIPWISLQFSVRDQQSKKIVQKLITDTFNMVLQMVIGQNSSSESTLRNITIETKHTSRGVKAVFQFRNQRFNQLQGLITCYFDQIFQTAINAKIKLQLKFAKNMMQLLDKQKFQNIWDIIAKDCQLTSHWMIQGAMTGIKQLILLLKALVDLQLSRFDPLSLIIIALTNMQTLETQLQFQNTIFTEQQSQSFSQFNQMRLQLLQSLSELTDDEGPLDQFNVKELIKYLDDEIFIDGSFGMMDFGLGVRIKGLRAILIKLLSEGSQGQERSQGESQGASQPSSSNQQHTPGQQQNQESIPKQQSQSQNNQDD